MEENNKNLVSTKEVDYLDEDKQIRGQNYVLMSFISPEDVLVDKEVFYFNKFLSNFSKDINELYDGIKSKYPESIDLLNVLISNYSYLNDVNELNEQYKFFKSQNSQDIESEFHKSINFKTSIRGIKIRGVFDTIDEAKNRIQLLKKSDKNFDIYVGQVGCWCPWSPNPADLENQEYSETQLNTLMKEYKKNMEDKTEVFEKRKEVAINLSKTRITDDIPPPKDLTENQEENNETVKDVINNSVLVGEETEKTPSEIMKEMEEKDAWQQRKD